MKESFRKPKNFHGHNKLLLANIMKVTDEYQKKNYKLTLRQLYYQLVSRDIIQNESRMYSKISRILGDARMSGYLDWDIIEDRIRVPDMPSEWNDVPDLLQSAVVSYRKNRHKNQKNYVEVWVEKDALSGVLSPITREYHIHLMVNRGYSSISAMYDASKRFQNNYDKECHILYLGDHDPSGLDMIRDIQERLNEFLVDVDVTPIALTKEQIEEYDPPPNPAKVDDPRADDYIAEHGEISWELDALQPEVLNRLLHKEIQRLIDVDLYNEVIDEENDEKDRLMKYAKRFK